MVSKEQGIAHFCPRPTRALWLNLVYKPLESNLEGVPLKFEV